MLPFLQISLLQAFVIYLIIGAVLGIIVIKFAPGKADETVTPESALGIFAIIVFLWIFLFLWLIVYLFGEWLSKPYRKFNVDKNKK